MDRLGTICVELLGDLYHITAHPLTIVETGTVYIDALEPEEKDLYERSTLAIARWIERTGDSHRFISIDYDGQHIETSKRVLAEHGLDGIVEHMRGDSALLMRNFQFPVDFVLLDSAAEPDITLGEYCAIFPVIREPGIVVIDDCFKTRERVNKGKLAIPYAERQGHRQWPLRNQARGIGFGQKGEAIVWGRSS